MAEKKKNFMDLRRKRRTFSSTGFAILLMIGMLLSTLLTPSTNVFANQIEGIDSNSSYNSYNEPVINSPDEGLFSLETASLEGQVEALLESERDPDHKISSNLASYLETGIVSDDIVSVNNNPRIITVVASGSDISEFVKIESTITLSGLSWIIGTVSKPADLVKMSEIPGVLSIVGDKIIDDAHSVTDLTKLQANVDNIDPIVAPENYLIRDIIGATETQDLYTDVDGDNVVIQIHDSGVDFGQTDLVDAFMRNGSGIPTVLDSMGYGISFTTATLTNNGSGYLETSALDPATTEFFLQGNIYALSELGFEFLVAEDYELPSVSSVSGNYKLGYLGQFAAGIMSVFPYILVDSVASGVYDTIFVDLDTGLYTSMVWVDLTYPDLKVKYSSYLDYSFADEDPHKWGDGSEILARDLDSDGINDVSAGALSNGIDIFGVFTTNKFFSGIMANGAGVSTFYDYIGHGTWCAAAAAGRGITPYKLWEDEKYNANDTITYLPGVAPAAKIQASNGLFSSAIIYGEMWSAGFEPNTTGHWVYTGNHLANVSSNSWGAGSFGSVFANGFDDTSILFDILTIPGYIDPTYPGVLHLSSSSNSGPGFGTTNAPGGGLLTMTVGASTNWGLLTNVFGEGQGYDQIATFSSRGPSIQGNPEPDILNVGSGGYNPSFLVQYFGNGTSAFEWWSGTSLACPVTAGSIALVFDAAATYNSPINGIVAKNIIKSTAKDFGLTGFEQGPGQVDLLRAVELAMGLDTDSNGKSLFTAGSLSTFAETSANMQDAWANYFGPSGYVLGGEDVDWPTLPLYDGSYNVIDASIFGGYLYPSDSWSTHLEIASGTGSVVSGLTVTAVEHKLIYTASASVLSTGYRTDFNMSEFFDSSIFLNADLLKIQFSWDSALVKDYTLNAPWLPFSLIADWNDINLNGTGDDWNRTLGIGDELDVLSYHTADYPAQVHTIGNPSVAFKNTPNVLVYDPLFRSDIIENWAGTDFTITIQAYSKEVMSEVSVAIEGGTSWEVFINLPADAQPGIHEGLIVLEANGAYQVVPLSYNVVAAVPNGPTKNTFGSPTNTPYDLGTFYCYADPLESTAGDWRFYTLDVTAGAAKTLAFEVNWTHTGTMVKMYAVDPSGVLIETNTPTIVSTDDRAQRMLIDVEGNLGLYTVAMQVIEFNETVMAEYYNVSVSYLTVAKSEITSSLTINPAEGNPVTGNLSVEWSPIALAELENLAITGTTLMIQRGYLYDAEDTMPTSGTSGWWDDVGKLSQCEYVVELFFAKGDAVSVEVGWDQVAVDLDIFIFAPSTTDYHSDNSLTGSAVTSGANPEVGGFIAPETGDYKLCLDWFSGGSGTLNIYYTLDGLKGPRWTNDSNVLTIDPYDRIADGSWTLTTFVDTNFNIAPIYTHEYVFDLHDPPAVSWVSHSGGENVTGVLDLEWAGTDPNPQDTLIYDVLYLAVDHEPEDVWGTIIRGTSGTTVSWDTVWATQEEGYFYLKVSVNDGWTIEEVNDTITVYIKQYDLQAPNIEGPADLTFDEGDKTVNRLKWTISDIHPSTIDFYIDGVLEDSIVWDTPIFDYYFDPKIFDFGVYALEIVANDTLGNVAIDEVIVTVEDGSTPFISLRPRDKIYELDSSSNSIDWVAIDNDASTYTVYLDGEVYDTGSWTSGVVISIDIDGLSVGSYNFTIEVSDGAGNKAFDQVMVTVNPVATTTTTTTTSTTTTNDTTTDPTDTGDDGDSPILSWVTLTVVLSLGLPIVYLTRRRRN